MQFAVCSTSAIRMATAAASGAATKTTTRATALPLWNFTNMSCVHATNSLARCFFFCLPLHRICLTLRILDFLVISAVFSPLSFCKSCFHFASLIIWCLCRICVAFFSSLFFFSEPQRNILCSWVWWETKILHIFGIECGHETQAVWV